MVFSSVFFLFCFFPTVLFCYFIVRKELRNTVLLLASIFFYAWGEPKFVVVLILSIFVNYLSGLCVHRFRGSIGAKLVFIVSLLLNLGILIYYKYVDFGINIINSVMSTFFEWKEIPALSIALPIGLSFFTFQGISYVIDVYRGNVPVQKNPMYIALYIALFPQLVAGPIVRYIDIHNEIKDRKTTLDDITEGAKRFIIGLAKKVMLADVLAFTTDQIFGLSIYELTPALAWLGAICYTFQIYFDFSGYSDMAIGIGRIFGFHFLENFNLPYISTSVTEFWRRWHISLSSWFRDYLYIPLGGNRKGNVYVNLFIVFLCTGLWHGASYTFLVWGLWHGLFLIAERIGKRKNIKLGLPGIVKWLYTATVVVLGWVLFRSESIGFALNYFRTMIGFELSPDTFRQFGLMYYMDNQVMLTLCAAFVISLGLPKLITARITSRYHAIQTVLTHVQNIALWLLLFGSMCMIVNGNYSPFIYFRF